VKTVLASSNSGKLKELSALLAPEGFELVSQDALGIAPAPEDGLTFIENALAKARHASAASGLPALADDSGLVVDALNGKPGIHSARYAGPDADDQANNLKLIDALRNETNRDAHYYCAIVFLRRADDPVPVIATGRWEGSILTSARGARGFGYDPYFFLPGLDMSAAELDPTKKNALSHRGQAVRSLVQQLRSN
jgi:XTP/dITP diphosphohydrolase